MTIEQQMRERTQPDWRGRVQKRFRWGRLRFELGRYCYIVHPVQGGRDIVWWEWEKP